MRDPRSGILSLALKTKPPENWEFEADPGLMNGRVRENAEQGVNLVAQIAALHSPGGVLVFVLVRVRSAGGSEGPEDGQNRS